MTSEAKSRADLPMGWALAELGEITQPSRPRLQPQDYPELPFIGMEHIEAHTMRLLGVVPANTMKSSAVHFKAGDVLYGRLRPYLNKVYSPDFEGLCSGEFIVLPVSDYLSSKFLKCFLNSRDFVSFASHLNEGDRPRVDFSQLAAYPVKLPPIAEQYRIVAKIEELFTKLDAGVGAMQTARAQLGRYRQAVLKAAVTGELTSSGSRQTLEGMKIYDALDRNSELSSNLYALPANWTWVKLKDITDIVVGYVGPISNDYTDKRYGVPLLSTTNISFKRLDTSEIKYVTPDFHRKNKKSQVRPGDILVARHGTSGLSSVIPDSIPDAHALNVVIVRKSPILASAYIAYLLNAEVTMSRLARSKTGSVQRIVNTTIIKDFFVPLPPFEEQLRIVDEVERYFSIADATERAIEQSLRQAERLRQSILKQAFEGRLVPQDPADEPAEVLLERIREERVRKQDTRQKVSRAPRKAKRETQMTMLD